VPSAEHRSLLNYRVDRLEATKRLPRNGEIPVATVDAWTIDSTEA
jgi:hypothetical protein